MSSNRDQISAFKAGLASAAQKLSKPTSAAPVTSTPSPAPSQASASGKQDLKRKRVDMAPTVFSQPADTGTGRYLGTQIAYAITYLKTKGTPQKIEDLLSYLSLQHRQAEYREAITKIMQTHGKVIYDPSGFNGKGSYAFRPKYNIRNSEQLIGYLQAQTTAQGLPVKDLAEGWPDAEDDIRKLENAHKLLVIRNKKDDHARMVWPDDPTLATHVEPEFFDIWHKIKLPDPETLRTELEKSGLVPTNKAQVDTTRVRAPEKKTKKARKSGKTTNTHMLSILRDYSHKRK